MNKKQKKAQLKKIRAEQAAIHRRSQVIVGSVRGRLLEGAVSDMLERLKTAGEFASFVAHAPNSPEDQAGKDFTIQTLDGRSISFGVTRSSLSFKKTRQKHPDIPVIWIPTGTTPETFVWHIRRLIASVDSANSLPS